MNLPSGISYVMRQEWDQAVKNLIRKYPIIDCMPESGMFRVASDSRPMAHLVDLHENDINGKCDCELFQMQKQPMLDRGHESSPETRCKHIKRARVFRLEMQLWKDLINQKYKAMI